MKMIFPVLLLVCTQVLGARALVAYSIRQPESSAVACNDSVVEAAADLSLRQLNGIRRKGFVFALHRITDAKEEFNIENGTVYQLTLDVVETECHVLSRQLWKDCEPKKLNEAVSGQCKTEFHIHKPRRIAHLHTYNCTLRQGPQRRGCPGCPMPTPLDDFRFLEVAKLSLKKYNSENNFNSYFSLANITRGRIQVVAGQAYHVEFTVRESSCNKTKSPKELDQCEILGSEDAATGYCKSFAVAHWSTPDDKKVQRVSCRIFNPEGTDAEQHSHDDGHHEHGHGDKKGHHGKKEDKHGKKEDKHGKKEDKHGKKHGDSEHAHGHKHGHKHKHGQKSSESHEDHSRNRTSSHSHNNKPKLVRPDPNAHTPTGSISYVTSEDDFPVPVNPSNSEHCPGQIKQYSPPAVPEAVPEAVPDAVPDALPKPTLIPK
ncbi:fetuin-B [Xenopus laevis]|uniref:Fetuin-B n=2 Tax=Xenopus laevis TaxID=8355 RepID=A0A1L8GA27_XENLA|nr:fetuin-B [Xenopus laevis]OCT80693.1 hypothetical protein XELAEV_18027507mg [Xenopus laevis]